MGAVPLVTFWGDGRSHPVLARACTLLLPAEPAWAFTCLSLCAGASIDWLGSSTSCLHLTLTLDD